MAAELYLPGILVAAGHRCGVCRSPFFRVAGATGVMGATLVIFGDECGHHATQTTYDFFGAGVFAGAFGNVGRCLACRVVASAVEVARVV